MTIESKKLKELKVDEKYLESKRNHSLVTEQNFRKIDDLIKIVNRQNELIEEMKVEISLLSSLVTNPNTEDMKKILCGGKK